MAFRLAYAQPIATIPAAQTSVLPTPLPISTAQATVTATASIADQPSTGEAMSSELLTAIIGGLIGGFLGVAATLVSSYYGPRKFEEWRERRREEREYGPRKRLLRQMLEDTRFPDGRTLENLCRISGTTPEECRRLLIEIKARGVTLQDGKEGWALISRKPLNEQ